MGRTNSGDEVLGSLSDSGAQPQGSSNPLGDLLGGQAGGTGGLGDLLGTLGGQGGAGGLSDLLGGLLGGQAGSGGGDLLGALSGQGGAGGLGDLLGGLLGGQGGMPQPSADLGGVLQVVLGKLASGQGGGLGNLLQMAAGGQQIEHQHLQASGLTDEVMAQTGLDTDTANAHLTQIIQTLGTQMGNRR